MKCPKGVTLYAGRRRWKAGQDVPKEYDDLLIPSVKAAPKPKKAAEEKSDGQPAGNGRG
jgi:hypothetical protein